MVAVSSGRSPVSKNSSTGGLSMISRRKHRRRASAMGIGFGAVIAGSALGINQTAQAQESAERRAVEEVVVTGTRIARDVTDASTPLAIISPEEIKLSGAMT